MAHLIILQEATLRNYMEHFAYGVLKKAIGATRLYMNS
jgi:hypothetical protein